MNNLLRVVTYMKVESLAIETREPIHDHLTITPPSLTVHLATLKCGAWAHVAMRKSGPGTVRRG